MRHGGTLSPVLDCSCAVAVFRWFGAARRVRYHVPRGSDGLAAVVMAGQGTDRALARESFGVAEVRGGGRPGRWLILLRRHEDDLGFPQWQSKVCCRAARQHTHTQMKGDRDVVITAVTWWKDHEGSPKEYVLNMASANMRRNEHVRGIAGV